MQFSQVGEFASSKSAMKTLAPELSALITIFRSTGPVISTRRSAISSGNGAIRQSPLADAGRLRQEVGQLARREPAACEASQALGAAREQLAPPLAELPLEVGQEPDRVGSQDVVGAHEGSLSTIDARRESIVLVVALAVLRAGARSATSARVTIVGRGAGDAWRA